MMPAVPRLPDLDDPRYLLEVGWFVEHEHQLAGTYDTARRQAAELWRAEVLAACGVDEEWLAAQTVLTIGCGCTGDLATWRAAAKVAADPLVYTYQQLGMLLADDSGTAPTVFLDAGAEEIPLVDGAAGLVLCRNALDHIVDPSLALQEMARVVADDGFVVVSVDIGGEPTPDEPSVFATEEDVRATIAAHLAVVRIDDMGPPHSHLRDKRVLVVAKRLAPAQPRLDKDAVRTAYERLAWHGEG